MRSLQTTPGKTGDTESKKLVLPENIRKLQTKSLPIHLRALIKTQQAPEESQAKRLFSGLVFFFEGFCS